VSRDQNEEKLLGRFGYSDVLFVHPCFVEERGGIVSLAACSINTEFLLSLSPPAESTGTGIREQDAVENKGKSCGDELVCASAEEIFTALLDRLEGVNSLFFLSGYEFFSFVDPLQFCTVKYTVLRIRDGFIPDPAKFHSGSRILLYKKKGQIFKTAPEAFLMS
jgi:hypothetical protein